MTKYYQIKNLALPVSHNGAGERIAPAGLESGRAGERESGPNPFNRQNGPAEARLYIFSPNVDPHTLGPPVLPLSRSPALI